MASIAQTTKSASGPASLGYLLKETVLLLAFLYLFIFNGTSQDFITLPVLVLTAALVSVVGLAWLWRGQAAPTPARWPLAIFLAVYLLAAIGSVDPRRSVEDFGWLLLIVFLFALAADLAARGWPAELILKTLLVAWSLVLVIVWIAPVAWYLDWLKTYPGEWLPSVVYRPSMPNTLAMSLNTFLMVALARLVYTRSAAARVMLAAVCAAALGMLYLTSSRAGWIGTAAGLGCLVLWLARKQSLPVQAAWQWAKARPLLLGAGGLALTAALAVGGWLLYRQTIHPTHGPLLSSRVQFWGPAVDTFRRYPILGQGPNTMSRSLIEAKTLGPGIIFVHAHSTPLNLLAETGLAGFAGALVFAAALALAMRRRWQTAAGSDRAVVMGASGALAAYAAHSLFDSFQTEPIGLWLLALVVGAALGGGALTEGKAAARPASPRRGRPWWVVALVAGAWLNLWLMQPLIQGVEAMNTSRPEEAARLLEQAAARDPRSAVAWQQLGLARAALAQDEEGYRGAIAALERATALDPAWGFNHGNLGALYRAAGDLAAARRHMEATFRLADVPVFHLNLAIIAEAQGDLDTARRAYQRAFEDDWAGWEGDFWEQTPLRREVRAALQPVPLSAEQMAALEAALAADPSSIGPYLDLAEAYLGSGRVEDSARLLERARFATALEGKQQVRQERLGLKLAEAQGKTAEAEPYRQRLALSCQMQGFTGPWESPTQHYNTVAFRKPSMYIEMVPQLVRMPCP